MYLNTIIYNTIELYILYYYIYIIIIYIINIYCAFACICTSLQIDLQIFEQHHVLKVTFRQGGSCVTSRTCLGAMIIGEKSGTPQPFM